MEITALSSDSIKIKGKQGTFIVNPVGKSIAANGVFVLGDKTVDKSKLEQGTVIIKGPGEYELAGVKIAGQRVDSATAYRLTVDKIDILIGNASGMARDHSKLSDNDIVILYADSVADPAFVTALEPNAVLFFGTSAEDTIKQFAKENYRKEQKYQTSLDKLPTEMESVLLTA